MIMNCFDDELIVSQRDFFISQRIVFDFIVIVENLEK